MKKRWWVLALLAASVAAFVGYCLGFVQGQDHTQGYTVTSQFTATDETLGQGGDAAASTPSESPPQPQSVVEAVGRIDLNHADEETLQQLPGIGPKRAEAIIRYREENGSFASVDEVMNVPGIGPELYEQIKGRITVAFY